MDKENVEVYLRKHAVIDGQGNMDGYFVPLSIAMIAIKQCLEGKLEYSGSSWFRTWQDAIIDNINKELKRLYDKYPLGEFMCTPMYSEDKTLVSCNLCTDWKSNIYYYESAPIEELSKHLQEIN
jgi:hypothetical protein